MMGRHGANKSKSPVAHSSTAVNNTVNTEGVEGEGVEKNAYTRVSNDVAKLQQQLDEAMKSMKDNNNKEYKEVLEYCTRVYHNDVTLMKLTGKADNKDLGIFQQIATGLEKSKADIKILKDNAEKQDQLIDDIDQDRRYPCLILHGLAEDANDDLTPLPNKVVQTLHEKIGPLNKQLTEYDISDCYRLGKLNKEAGTADGRARARPIFIRFTRYLTRRRVWLLKKQLKGTGVVLTEFLTPRRQELLRAAIAAAGKHKAWSFNGAIYMLGQNGKVKINKLSDIQNVRL